MKYFSKIVGILMLSTALTSHAGVVRPTAHSRANCGGFNESVTWHLGHSYWWRVESHHFIKEAPMPPTHILNTGTHHTWRAAAYHATEAYSSRGDKWWVVGYHFYHPDGNVNKRERLDTTTQATDCNIYDGWWDY